MTNVAYDSVFRDRFEKYSYYRNLMIETLCNHVDRARNLSMGNPHDWTFSIDDIKPLGTCNYRTKTITIDSKLFNTDDEYEIRDTVLHECAHALCGPVITHTGRNNSHGVVWKRWASICGATPKAKVRLSERTNSQMGLTDTKPPKYHIVACIDGEFKKYTSCNRRLKNIHIRAMKKDRRTFGKLYHIKYDDWIRFEGNTEEIKKRVFR